MDEVEASEAQTIEAQLEGAARLLRGRIAVLTGAGVSTDSGIPDYRGSGSPRRTPMTAQQFLADPSQERRYWAGSHLGWRRFRAVRPNAAHEAIAELERRAAITGVITQNVDGLHQRAGSRRVVELHGSMARVRCLRCGQRFARDDISQVLERENPWLAVPEELVLSPDGDVETDRVDAMVVPRCSVCGGQLKPDVVFFGEFVPSEVFRQARSLLDDADALLVAGSSLVVNSGMRFIERARRRGLPIVIINRGATKGDARADVKLDAGAAQMLSALVGRLGEHARRGS